MSSKQTRRMLAAAQKTFDDMKAKSNERYKEQAEQENTIKLFKKAIVFEDKLLTEDTWLLKLHGEHVYLYGMPDAFPKLRKLLFDGFYHHISFTLTPSVHIRYDDGEISLALIDDKALDFLKAEGIRVNVGYMGAGIKKLEERLMLLKELKCRFKGMEDDS